MYSQVRIDKEKIKRITKISLLKNIWKCTFSILIMYINIYILHFYYENHMYIFLHWTIQKAFFIFMLFYNFNYSYYIIRIYYIIKISILDCQDVSDFSHYKMH